jgi:membrane protease YdiL (CAAX protease family)
LVVVIFAASSVEGLLLDRGLLTAAIVVGVLATVAGMFCWLGHLRGIRRDLETGRAAM